MAGPWTSEDLEAALGAMQSAPVETFALKGLKGISEVVALQGEKNLSDRRGGGKYKRDVARVFTQKRGSSWAAILETPWMGMEWGGFITNVWDTRVHSARAKQIGLEPMWAPWHTDYKQGYIMGSSWVALGKGQATQAVADQVLEAYTAEFNAAGLKKG